MRDDLLYLVMTYYHTDDHATARTAARTTALCTASITVTVHQEYAVLHAISSSVLLFSTSMSAVSVVIGAVLCVVHA